MAVVIVKQRREVRCIALFFFTFFFLSAISTAIPFSHYHAPSSFLPSEHTKRSPFVLEVAGLGK
jgi:hypothetical protein